MTMVERVAWVLQRQDESFGPSEELDPAFLDEARAVIEVMREPTEAMKELGQRYQDEECPMTSEAFWQMMIDAALSEAPSPR
jgi:hypothetical protein